MYGEFAPNIKPCAFWRKQGGEPATRGRQQGRRADPAVRAGFPDAADQWPGHAPCHAGAKMVTVTGGVGHGLYGFMSCADKKATAYLTTGMLPTKDVTCKGPAVPAAPSARPWRGGVTSLPLPAPQG
ncbi:alpha/beta hydrolase [Streptomyces sp. NPDC057438]|uniref:alpha/beta hydrolase n=1 Tax=Streptomyces sp. NPDC057438 TaxID=3346133 RepID=UPI0036A006C2